MNKTKVRSTNIENILSNPVVLQSIILLDNTCANALLRLNKTFNNRIKSNTIVMQSLYDNYLNIVTNDIDTQIKRAFEIHNEPAKIVGLQYDGTNTYKIYFNGNAMPSSYNFVHNTSSKNAIECIVLLREKYKKIIESKNRYYKVSTAQNTNCDKIDDVLSNLLNDKYIKRGKWSFEYLFNSLSNTNTVTSLYSFLFLFAGLWPLMGLKIPPHLRNYVIIISLIIFALCVYYFW